MYAFTPHRPRWLPSAIAAIAIGALALLTAAPTLAAPPPGYKLVWHDEFNGPIGSRPNPAYWGYDLGFSIRNHEQETYTKTNAVIVADKNAIDGRSLDISSTEDASRSGDGEYDSSEINSMGKVQFLYGYFECRAKVPLGGPSYQGYWPAFWFCGDDGVVKSWPANGELDVMEHLNGTEPLVAHQTLHAPNGSGSGYQYGYAYTGRHDLGDAYHLYQMLWTPEAITFYTDGIVTGSVKESELKSGQDWPFNDIDNPMFILVNLAIGGGWPGNVTSQTVFPAHFLVDYVRVYEQKQYNTWLYDPGFESGTFDPLWNVSSPNGTESAAHVVPTSADAPSHSGRYHCSEGSTTPYDVTVSQTPVILPRGTYTLTAWVKSSGGQSKCRMYVEKFSKPDASDYRGIDIPQSSSYVQITIPNVKVSTGECECGFQSAGAAGEWLDIDDVALTRN